LLFLFYNFCCSVEIYCFRKHHYPGFVNCFLMISFIFLSIFKVKPIDLKNLSGKSTVFLTQRIC
jgi:hypothetical protein